MDLDEVDYQLLGFIMKDKYDEGVLKFGDLIIIDYYFENYKKEDIIVSNNIVQKYIFTENELTLIKEINDNTQINNRDRVLILSFTKEPGKLLQTRTQYFLKFEYIHLLKENIKIVNNSSHSPSHEEYILDNDDSYESI